MSYVCFFSKEEGRGPGRGAIGAAPLSGLVGLVPKAFPLQDLGLFRSRKVVQKRPPNRPFSRSVLGSILDHLFSIFLRIICVFQCFFNITARKPLFLRGIVHLRFAKFCIELFKTIVFYEVSFFRVGARTTSPSKSVVFTRDRARQYAKPTCFTRCSQTTCSQTYIFMRDCARTFC